MNLRYSAGEADSGKSVKHILKVNLGLSERLIKRLKYAGKITCNNSPVYVNYILMPGDMLEAKIDFIEESLQVVPENMELDILYEDEGIIALNKGPDMVVHPTFGHSTGTIANALMYYFSSKGLALKIRPVSRLDRDTSGIILFAKNQFIQDALIRQMNQKTFIKKYEGIVHGIVEKEQDTLSMPIERKPGSIILRQVSDTGAMSVTHYTKIKELHNATFLEFRLETGRTHQIRVHCQAIGHPLLGDTLYSDIECPYINRQALHSKSVSFLHPITGCPMEISAPLPDDIERTLEILGK